MAEPQRASQVPGRTFRTRYPALPRHVPFLYDHSTGSGEGFMSSETLATWNLRNEALIHRLAYVMARAFDRQGFTMSVTPHGACFTTYAMVNS